MGVTEVHRRTAFPTRVRLAFFHGSEFSTEALSRHLRIHWCFGATNYETAVGWTS